LLFDGKALLPRTRSDNIELTARAVRRVVKDRATGQTVTLLDDVTLVVRPREFVCLLGPAGCGKSTLLNALSGRLTPDGGRVLVNGADLHTHFDALKRDIVVVPQKNILHEALSVGEALWYTAGLRLPPDLAAREVDQCIDETLHTVNLQDHRGTLIRYLSGLQTLVLAAVTCWWCGEVVPFVRECWVLLILAGTGVTVGLAISVAARTEEMAVTLIPVAVIPQIIFAGVIAPLSGLSKFLSRTLIAVYWGNRGLESLLSEEAIRMIRLEEQGSLWTAFAVLGAHACVFMAAALVMLSWQGRRSSLLGQLVRRTKTA
jgi:ABC-type transport system involved in cytochrome c biogenesis ATPase subunit